MACSGLGVILDTSVFVCWCDGDPGYGAIIDAIRSSELYIVVCQGLRIEYLRQLQKRYIGAARQVLESRIRKLYAEGILFETISNQQKEIVIHRKDQHVIDCALNDQFEVHIIVTDNQRDFVSDNTSYRLPILITSKEFLVVTNRNTICAEAKRVKNEIKKYGTKARFI